MSYLDAARPWPNTRRDGPHVRPKGQARGHQAPGFSRQMLKLSAEAMVTQIR